jgi:hypothetical protein
MYRIFLLLLLLPAFLVGNPFLIDFPEKKSLTNEDYLEVQSKLQAIDLSEVLEEWYPKNPPRKSLLQWKTPLAYKEDFKNRISKAFHHTLIDPATGKFPVKELVKINEGGSNCIVCYATYDGKYQDLIKTLPKKLEEVGFNGYFFYMIGGFPNPTGKEIRYAGVPYSFKVFALLEAQKLGFDKVLWIDTSYLPLKDPTPLFNWIQEKGYFLKMHAPFAKYLLPKTREFLQHTTGVDVLKERYVSAQIIGFDLKHPQAQEFISEYYRLVKLGWPFFSCFPEEYVFSAIVGKESKKWLCQPYNELSFAEIKLGRKDRSWAEKEGYFFLQTLH